ncbi:MAG: hypothetical protein NTV63_04315, partial [Candidatus Woesearchaeota archaeon]|nr:hypothetical protein [Candidatus Woesearchaeota archaeon]
MNSREFLGIMIVLMVFSFGCAGTGSTKDKNPFVGGTNGILINFMESAPPAEVFDGGEFPFDAIITLTNDGEYTVPKEKVWLWLIGIDPNEFGLPSSALFKQPTEELIKVERDSSGNKIPSTPTEIIFTGFNYYGHLTGDVSYNIIASLCYNYETTANAKICVKSNLLDSSETVCKLNEKKTIYSSGAPIQVTSFSESVSGKDRINFEFKIEQKGNGVVFKEDVICADKFANRNRVFVTVNTGMTGTLS